MNTRNQKMLLIILLTVIVLFALTFLYISKNKPTSQNEAYDPETPYNTKISIDKNGCLLAQWQTKEKSIGYIKYGEEKNNVMTIAQTSEGLLYADNHSVTVCTINSEKDYYVIVVSNNIPYGYQGEPIKTSRN